MITGVASADRHAPHTSPAGLLQGATAAVKSSMTRTGQAEGGSVGGSTSPAAAGGGGGGGFGQLPSAASDATFTPAAMARLACAEMQAPSVATSAADTPAKTNGVASACEQAPLHAVTASLHGATAAEKF